MEDGELIELGTHDELLASGGRYATLCRQQFMGGKGEQAEAVAASGS